jgi:hypothetical protein
MVRAQGGGKRPDLRRKGRPLTLSGARCVGCTEVRNASSYMGVLTAVATSEGTCKGQVGAGGVVALGRAFVVHKQQHSCVSGVRSCRKSGQASGTVSICDPGDPAHTLAVLLLSKPTRPTGEGDNPEERQTNALLRAVAMPSLQTVAHAWSPSLRTVPKSIAPGKRCSAPLAAKPRCPVGIGPDGLGCLGPWPEATALGLGCGVVGWATA